MITFKEKMEYKMIHEFIKQMNNNSLIIKGLVQISKNVDYCEVAGNKIANDFIGWYRFFFIKNRNGKYVGAVNDMGYLELHWFVLPNHRRKGYLSKALEESILEYLFRDRESQAITAESKKSIKVALNAGFIQDEEHRYLLTKKDFLLNKKRKGHFN